MDDKQIIALYLARAEEAISETAAKYGRLCRRIANNILGNDQDSEECVNDTYLGLWNAIPPTQPNCLPAFIGTLARNLALKRYDYLCAEKRTPQMRCSLEELGECVCGCAGVEEELENRRIEAAISDFLRQQEEEKRTVFLLRYWYFDSIEDICRRTGFSQSKVRSMLHRLRGNLRAHLEKEGIEL